MTDIIVNANNESGLLQALYKAHVDDFYSYYNAHNMCNSSKNIIEVDFQAAATNAAYNSTRLGARLFSEINLRTHNNIICTLNEESLLTRLKDVDVSSALLLNKISRNDAAYTTTSKVCVPVLMPYFELFNHQMHLDLGFCEQLELDAVVNTP